MVFILSFYRSFSFYRLFGHRRVVPPTSSRRFHSRRFRSSFVRASRRAADLYSMKGTKSIRAAPLQPTVISS